MLSGETTLMTRFVSGEMKEGLLAPLGRWCSDHAELGTLPRL